MISDLLVLISLATTYQVNITLPTLRYWPSECAVSGCPVELDSAFIYVYPRAGARYIATRGSVAGMAGQTVHWPFNCAKCDTVICVTTDSLARPCPSNMVLVDCTTSVPNTPPKVWLAGKPGWYDIAGRGMHGAPRTPGIYFLRDMKGVRRVVMLTQGDFK